MAYFDTLRTLMLLFAVICILYIPIMVMYANNDTFGSYSGNAFYNMLSLGNIGQAEAQCIQ